MLLHSPESISSPRSHATQTNVPPPFTGEGGPKGRERAVVVFRHVSHEGLGTLARALKGRALPFRYIDVARGRPAFPPVGSIAGLIVMGGPMGVYEKKRFPFLARESRYIRRAIAEGVPVLGICLGSQLIADALGARVYPNGKKEIGWYRVKMTEEGRRDRLTGTTSSPWVFQWHGDTFDLPRGATLLASSPLCRNQAFRYGTAVYGLQYHLEVDAPMIRLWLRQPGAKSECAAVGPSAFNAIRARTPVRAPRLGRIAERFFSGFCDLLQNRLESRPCKNNR